MPFVYRGELTPKEMKLYGYEYKKCLSCNSDELVVQQFVNDVICEDCGLWQSEMEQN